MTLIALRTYIKEIESLIDHGQTEKAIAHCKYILERFPKHTDTYRLIGKAYLESERYNEASDIFQRVLAVIPDDFASQVGISIIREDEGNLNSAIWHMERAFEVQPSNTAIYDELRRLYGRRDGITPPKKLHLTRGALVRMYARGNLFPQAIAEARAALSEDPERIDLEIILARCYYLSGQEVETIELCSRLVKKLPYCYEANLILADLLPSTSKAEDAKIFQQRARAIDPYLSFTSPEAPTSDQVPDNAITMERRDRQPYQSDSQQSDPISHINDETQNNKETISTSQSLVPDWLDDIFISEKGDMSGEGKKSLIDYTEGVPHALTTDWIQKVITEKKQSTKKGGKDQQSLKKFETTQTTQKPDSDAISIMNNKFEKDNSDDIYPFTMNSKGLTNWMDETNTPVASSSKPQPEEVLPDWLQEYETGDMDTAPLKFKTPSGLTKADQISTNTSHVDETVISSTSPFTEKHVTSLDEAAQIAEEPTSEKSGIQEKDIDSAFAWLESLAANQGVDENTLLVAKEEREKEPPSWIKKIETNEISKKELSEEEDSITKSIFSDEPEAIIDREDTIPDWIKELKSDQDAEIQISPDVTQIEEDLITQKKPKLAEIKDAKTAILESLQEESQSAETSFEHQDKSFPPFKSITTGELQDGFKDIGAAPFSQSKESNITEPTTEKLMDIDVPSEVDEISSTTSDQIQEPVIPTFEAESEIMETISEDELLDIKTTSPEIGEIISQKSDFPLERIQSIEVEDHDEVQTQEVDMTTEWILEELIYPQVSISQAQSALSRGDFEKAGNLYSELIQLEQHLDEVIHDLNEALSQHPIIVSLWQTLGDAYRRSNRIQDALDAYTKAEELL